MGVGEMEGCREGEELCMGGGGGWEKNVRGEQKKRNEGERKLSLHCSWHFMSSTLKNVSTPKLRV